MNVIDLLEEELNCVTTAIRLHSEDVQDIYAQLIKEYGHSPRKLWIDDEVLDAIQIDSKCLLILKHRAFGELMYTAFWVKDFFSVYPIYRRFSYPFERNFGLNEEAMETEEGFLTCVYNAACVTLGSTHEPTVLQRLRWAACILTCDQIRLYSAKEFTKSLYDGNDIAVGATLDDVNQVFLHFWRKHRDVPKDTFEAAMSYNQNILKVFSAIINED